MNNKSEYDQTVKIFVMGGSQVGKSNLVDCFVSDQYQYADHYIPSRGQNSLDKIITVDTKRVNTRIWEEGSKTMQRPDHIHGADAIVLVCDVTDKASFDNIVSNYLYTERKAKDDTPIVIIATKSDLISRREVSEAELKKFADEHGLKYFEASAKTGKGVESAFTSAISQTLAMRQKAVLTMKTQPSSPTPVIQSTTQQNISLRHDLQGLPPLTKSAQETVDAIVIGLTKLKKIPCFTAANEKKINAALENLKVGTFINTIPSSRAAGMYIKAFTEEANKLDKKSTAFNAITSVIKKLKDCENTLTTKERQAESGFYYGKK